MVAVAGVARPERFVATLERCGARVVDRLLVSRIITPTGDADVAARVRGRRARGSLVTTEKDLVKLAGRAASTALRALRVALEVDDGDRLVDLLEGVSVRRVAFRSDLPAIDGTH